jgi:hypothetical protein
MSVSLLLGIGAAVVASSLYSLGIALQALDAREVHPGHGMRLSLVRQLVVRGRWLAGTGLSVLGWPFQVSALLLAPLVVVQPALAAGLLVLLALGSRMLGERSGPQERLAMVAIVAGVIGLAWAAPERSSLHASGPVLGLVLGGLGLLVIAPYLLSLVRRTSAPLSMLGAGLGFAWGGIATKLVSDGLASGHWFAAVAWGVASTAVEGVALLSEMSALQTRPAIQVAPVVFVVQTIVPVALAPALVHERLFAGSAARSVALMTSLAVLVAGAWSLARSPLLAALIAGDTSSADSGEEPNPSAASADASASKDRSEAGEPSTVKTTTSPARSAP